MSKKKILKIRRIIRNIGIINVFCIPIYIFLVRGIAERSPSEYVDAIEKILGYSSGFTLICLVQYRCPNCGAVLNPRKYLEYKCPYCDYEFN